MEKIILASGSPRRKVLLRQVGIPFRSVVPDSDETYRSPTEGSTGVVATVKKIAREKVDAVLKRSKDPVLRWIVGVDTVIEIDGAIIGKPTHVGEARTILELLSGRTHRVYSGICLLPHPAGLYDTRNCCTEVGMKKLTSEDISFYLRTREWMGVAGAYRIQKKGSFLIDWIKGSYSNVVGLPLETFYGMLKDNKYPLMDFRSKNDRY